MALSVLSPDNPFVEIMQCHCAVAARSCVETRSYVWLKHKQTAAVKAALNIIELGTAI